MRTSKSYVVKAFLPGGDHCYYSSLGACCRYHNVRYEERLVYLIETGGLAPDGKTFFDYPTDLELEMLEEGTLKFQDKRLGKKKNADDPREM